jgi:hypothetical protein
MMGMFDLPAPLFRLADGLVGPMLPAWASLTLWGLLAGVVSVGMYLAVSPQQRLKRIKGEARDARDAIVAYDGDFDGLLPLVRRSLGLSLRQVALTSGPAILAALPVICTFAWLSNAYEFREPAAGAAVPIRVEPATAQVAWDPPADSSSSGDTRLLNWPGAGRQVRLIDAAGRVLATFPLHAPVPELRKFAWWNVLIGNPAGYLPRATGVGAVEVGLAPREFLSVGPSWMRGWELIFFASLAVISVAIRTAFRVH